MATIRELRTALMAVPEGEADSELLLWMPGARIRVTARPFKVQGQWMVEGNVEPDAGPPAAIPRTGERLRTYDHAYQAGAFGVCRRCGEGSH
jgi:hypothetical protein